MADNIVDLGLICKVGEISKVYAELCKLELKE